MGRSTQAQAQENRAKILDRANVLFRQHGVENVSVSDVMSACGMTVGGFYKHFDSKEALVTEVCDLAFRQALRTWDKVYNHADAHAKQRQLELVRRYLDNRAPERRCPILAFAPRVTTGDAAEPSIQAYQAGIHELFDKFLAGEHPDGANTDTETSRAAMVLFAAMVGARVLNQAVGNASWVQEIEAAVIDAAASQTPRRKHLEQP